MTDPTTTISTLSALACAQVSSPTSRALIKHALANGIVDVDTMDVIKECEAAHLHCRGRVHMDPQYPRPNGRDPGVIDDAKLQSFDPETGTLIVRLDTWQNLAFWAECHIGMDQLQKWLLDQGVEMQWKLL